VDTIDSKPLSGANPEAQPAVTGRESRPRRGAALAWVMVVLAATFATYAVCLGHFFFMDDFWHLDHAGKTEMKDAWRPWVYSWEDDKAYWFAASRVHGSREQAFFRPLVTLLYTGGLRLWGDRPAAFHAVSLGAHLATTAMVFWLAWLLIRPAWAAAFCAAVFGLHPGQYEAVEWIAANADALLALLGTLAVAAFVESDRRRPGGQGFYALSLGSFALALGSKEMAVTVPLLLLGYQVLFRPQGRRRIDVLRPGWIRHAPFWAMSIAYALWRLPSLAGVYRMHEGGNYLSDVHSPLFVPQMALNFTFYVLHFLIPYPVFPVSFRETLGAHCWWLAALCAAGFVLVIRRLARSRGDDRRVLRFGVFWVAATLMPFSFVDPAQRLVHFPAAGFALAAGATASFLWRQGSPDLRRWLPRAALALLAVYAVGSYTYASAMGYVSKRVEKIASGLEDQISRLPPGSEIYLVDLWQPAWMVEHFFEATHPDRHHEFHVLTFDPEITPGALRDSPGVAGWWFNTLFGTTGHGAPVRIRWDSPRVLTLHRESGAYLNGIVDKILDVAPEASDPAREVDAGEFVARAAGLGGGGVTAFSFRWKQGPPGPARVFLLWVEDHWERLEPPPGWDGAGLV